MIPEHANEETTWPENQTVKGHPDEVEALDVGEELCGGDVAARGQSSTDSAESAMRGAASQPRSFCVASLRP